MYFIPYSISIYTGSTDLREVKVGRVCKLILDKNDQGLVLE